MRSFLSHAHPLLTIAWLGPSADLNFHKWVWAGQGLHRVDLCHCSRRRTTSLENESNKLAEESPPGPSRPSCSGLANEAHKESRSRASGANLSSIEKGGYSSFALIWAVARVKCAELYSHLIIMKEKSRKQRAHSETCQLFKYPIL